MRRFFVVFVFIHFVLFIFSGNVKPRVISAIQAWESYGGKYILPSYDTILIERTDSSEIYDVAHILSDDLKTMFGYNYKIKVSENINNADIVLSLNTESYKKDSEENELNVSSGIKIQPECKVRAR